MAESRIRIHHGAAGVTGLPSCPHFCSGHSEVNVHTRAVKAKFIGRLSEICLPEPVIPLGRLSSLGRARTERSPFPRGRITNFPRRTIILGLPPDALKGDSRHSAAEFRATRPSERAGAAVSPVAPVSPRLLVPSHPTAGPRHAAGGGGRPFRSNAASSAILVRCPSQLSLCQPQMLCRQPCSKIA